MGVNDVIYLLHTFLSLFFTQYAQTNKKVTWTKPYFNKGVTTFFSITNLFLSISAHNISKRNIFEEPC